MNSAVVYRLSTVRPVSYTTMAKCASVHAVMFLCTLIDNPEALFKVTQNSYTLFSFREYRLEKMHWVS